MERDARLLHCLKARLLVRTTRPLTRISATARNETYVGHDTSMTAYITAIGCAMLLICHQKSGALRRVYCGKRARFWGCAHFWQTGYDLPKMPKPADVNSVQLCVPFQSNNVKCHSFQGGAACHFGGDKKSSSSSYYLIFPMLLPVRFSVVDAHWICETLSHISHWQRDSCCATGWEPTSQTWR
jgi:hypothetical protein